MEAFRQIGWLIRKDLALQFRTKDMLALIIVFSVLVVLIFCFAFGPIFPEKLEERGKLAASVLWATFLFAGIITLNRSFDIERANGALHGLRLTGVDASYLYLSKVVSIFVFLILLEVIVTPIALQFLDVITVLPVALNNSLGSCSNFNKNNSLGSCSNLSACLRLERLGSVRSVLSYRASLPIRTERKAYSP